MDPSNSIFDRTTTYLVSYTLDAPSLQSIQRRSRYDSFLRFSIKIHAPVQLKVFFNNSSANTAKRKYVRLNCYVIMNCVWSHLDVFRNTIHYDSSTTMIKKKIPREVESIEGRGNLFEKNKALRYESRTRMSRIEIAGNASSCTDKCYRREIYFPETRRNRRNRCLRVSKRIVTQKLFYEIINASRASSPKSKFRL